MSCKTNCLVTILIIIMVLTVLFLLFIINIDKDNYFYCYMFQKSKFFKSNTISDINDLYSKMNLKNNEKLRFDYIIIGAGTAGSVIANRLSEKESSNILVVEAGKNMNGNALKEIPGIAPLVWSNSYGDFTWNYTTLPQQHVLNREFKWPSGKMIGGTSSNNFMLFSQIFASDYDKWSEASNCSNWNWNNVDDYFFQIEENSVTSKKSTKLGHLWTKAWEQDNMTVNEHGMKFFIKNGLRWDMSKEHLYFASRRHNVFILTETLVQKLIFKQNRQTDNLDAIGIQIENKGIKNDIYVDKKVFLSAGTVQNVRILKESLESYGTLNSIGKHLKDHIFVPLVFETLNSEVFGYSSSLFSLFKEFWSYIFSKHSFLAETVIDGGQVYIDTELNNQDWSLIQFSPNVQIALISNMIDSRSLDSIFSKYLDSVSLDVFKGMVSKARSSNGFTIFIILVHPKSEGTIDYKNTSFEINPNYLSKPEDLVVILKAIKRVFDFLATSEKFKGININQLKPSNDDKTFLERCAQEDTKELEKKFDLRSDENFDLKYWSCYVKQMAYSIFHFHGTLRFGNTTTNPEYAVDCNLKLQKTNNVHVVDASVIPYPVAGGLQSVAMMIAEKFTKELISS